MIGFAEVPAFQGINKVAVKKKNLIMLISKRATLRNIFLWSVSSFSTHLVVENQDM